MPEIPPYPAELPQFVYWWNEAKTHVWYIDPKRSDYPVQIHAIHSDPMLETLVQTGREISSHTALYMGWPT